MAALAAKKQAAAAKEPVPSYEEEHEDDDNTNTQNTHTNTDTNADTQQQGGTEGQQAGGKGGAGLTLRAQTAKGKPVQASAQAAAKPAAPKNAAAAAAAASLIAEFSGRGESQVRCMAALSACMPSARVTLSLHMHVVFVVPELSGRCVWACVYVLVSLAG